MGADLHETRTSETGGMGLVDRLITREANVGNIGCADDLGGACHNHGFTERRLEAMEGEERRRRGRRHFSCGGGYNKINYIVLFNFLHYPLFQRGMTKKVNRE
jgi:hypothetical protein